MAIRAFFPPDVRTARSGRRVHARVGVVVPLEPAEAEESPALPKAAVRQERLALLHDSAFRVQKDAVGSDLGRDPLGVV